MIHCYNEGGNKDLQSECEKSFSRINLEFISQVNPNKYVIVEQ